MRFCYLIYHMFVNSNKYVQLQKGTTSIGPVKQKFYSKNAIISYLSI